MADYADSPAAEKKDQAQGLLINTQFVKDLSFEAPLLPQILGEMKKPPQIDISVDVQAAKFQDNVFNITLRFRIEAKVEEKPLFLCELDYGCLATVNVPAEHLEPVLLIEIPRYLFPFARNIVADITRESGLPPLMISPIDFVSLYRQRTSQKQEGDAPAEAEAPPHNKVN